MKYKNSSSLLLRKMAWPETGGSNYLNEVRLFLGESMKPASFEFTSFYSVLIPILENVHDRGSGNCEIFIGRHHNDLVMEVFERDGRFDLSTLPFGAGGHGYREMQRNVCDISHSADGKRVFISMPIIKTRIK